MKDFILKRPSAWVPILMSVGALTIPWAWVFVFGPDPSGDEGGAAHIFQLLMGGQVPIILYFIIRWLPEKPKETLKTLAFQITLIILAFVPVYTLEH